MRLGQWLGDLIWPRTCEVCGCAADRPDHYVCTDCLNRLPFVPVKGLCRRCGRDAVGLDGEFLCQECRELRPHFDRVGCVFRFDGEAREAVNAFKFRRHLWLREDFADGLEACVRARFRVGEIACVTPVPSTLAHRWERGYSPCEILASALARRIGKPCRGLLRRVGSPRRQGELTEEERRTNVLGTFAPRTGCGGGAVLLVDDIMTTGSTLSEASRVLKAAGAGKVWCVTLARAWRN